jgi:hypothetical protein
MIKEHSLKDSQSDRFVKLAGKGKNGQKLQHLKHLNTRIPSHLLLEIKKFCAKNNVTIQNFVTNALQARLRESK